MNRTLQISLTLLYSKFSKYFELLEMPYLEKKPVLRYSLSFAPTLVAPEGRFFSNQHGKAKEAGR